MLLQQPASLCQELAHQILAFQNQNVKDEEVQRGAGGTVVLQQAEGGLVVAIEGDNLTVAQLRVKPATRRTFVR